MRNTLIPTSFAGLLFLGLLPQAANATSVCAGAAGPTVRSEPCQSVRLPATIAGLTIPTTCGIRSHHALRDGATPPRNLLGQRTGVAVGVAAHCRPASTGAASPVVVGAR